MILIDNEKTVIAGDAVKVLSEIAAVLDRLILEIASKNGGPTYDEVQEKFAKLMDIVVDVRGTRKDFNPEEIIEDGKIQRLFKEEFFNLINRQPEPRRDRSGSRSSKSDSGDAEDMLERAMRKLNEAKKQDTPKKKKKSKKNKKDD